MELLEIASSSAVHNYYNGMTVSMLEGAWPHYDWQNNQSQVIRYNVSMLEGAWPHYDWAFVGELDCVFVVFPCSKGRGPITTI